ncbi:MAG: hypothetical protein WAU47_00380, partial [Desulfobaccales bacterium]
KQRCPAGFLHVLFYLKKMQPRGFNLSPAQVRTPVPPGLSFVVEAFWKWASFPAPGQESASFPGKMPVLPSKRES